jgi:adenylate cyclase
MSVDWQAEGLLENVEDPSARRARVALLEDLHGDGVELDELRRAVHEDRLALLPVERILAPEGDRLTALQLAERTGAELEFLSNLRTALGLPRPADDDPIYTEDDVRAIELQLQLDRAGFAEADRLEVARVLGQSMAQLAYTVRDVTRRTVRHPGDTELSIGLRYAETAKGSAPLLGPLLEHVLNLHLREQLCQDVISAADLAGGHVAGTAQVGVCFADLVGFTRLGEELPSEELGAVAGRLAELATDVAAPPVRVVKLIGDAAMLVSPPRARGGAGRGDRPGGRGRARGRALSPPARRRRGG